MHYVPLTVLQQKEEAGGDVEEEVIRLPQSPGGPARDHPFRVLPSQLPGCSFQGSTGGLKSCLLFPLPTPPLLALATD